MKPLTKAYRVTWPTLYFYPPIVHITWAVKASQAKFSSWKVARDLGFAVELGDFKVRRAAEYDASSLARVGDLVEVKWMDKWYQRRIRG